MSSIAYVTDERMLEYHRLCRNRAILFWRLSSKKKFSDFRKGDLLFFFARPHRGRKKGFVGYAHYDSLKRLSLNQMWDQYGTFTGYDTKQQLSEAIAKAAKGGIPKQMSCLYLTDLVFFLSPVYPDEVGLSIPANLESYCYLDRSNPRITVDILRRGAKHGIDLWSADDSTPPEVIFSRDEVRHQVADIHKLIGKETLSEKERNTAHKLARKQIEAPEWEMVRGSRTDCLKLEEDRIVLALPFASQANDRDLRVRELMGRIVMYRLWAQKVHLEKKLVFEVMAENLPEDVKELVKQLNDSQL